MSFGDDTLDPSNIEEIKRTTRETKMRDALACVAHWFECGCHNWMTCGCCTNPDGSARTEAEHKQHVRRTVEEALQSM